MPRVRRRKKIAKVRAEIEAKNILEKINKTKNCFPEKITKQNTQKNPRQIFRETRKKTQNQK